MFKSLIIHRSLFIACLVVTFLLAACKNNDARREPLRQSDFKEPLIEANKEAVRTESEQIDDFIARHGWKMNTTTTGLRYMIYKPGIGPGATSGKIVTLNYSTTLLTGDTVYTSKVGGPIEFEVGRGQVISGLEEAILLLKVGDRAKIIIPSHLAFGLIGDQNKITYKASLVYDVDFVSIK